jgi:hypothetical protein
VLENKAAVLDKLPSAAAYLNHLDDSQEEFDATRFGSVELEKLRIKDTASREGVDIVEKVLSRLAEKKLQFLFSKALMQARVNQFEQQMLLDDFIQLCACDQLICEQPTRKMGVSLLGDQTEVSFLAETHFAVHHHRHRQ